MGDQLLGQIVHQLTRSFSIYDWKMGEKLFPSSFPSSAGEHAGERELENMGVIIFNNQKIENLKRKLDNLKTGGKGHLKKRKWENN